MQINIQVIQTEISNKGKYNQLEVTYKNLEAGKVESKKLMSFVQPDQPYKALADAKAGNVFTVTMEKEESSKDGKSYWVWKQAEQAAPGAASKMSTAPTTTGYTAPKSNYETPEERAKKQVYIVRQSSLSNAIALLSVGAKLPPSTELVLQEAQKFTDFVFSEPKVSLADMPSDTVDIE
jgi:hypothetical protein